jgi:hypothetical protein
VFAGRGLGFKRAPKRLDHGVVIAVGFAAHALGKPRAHKRLAVFEMRSAGDEAGAERLRERFLRRMWNLASFMQGVKQRFSQWFNARNDRAGTLWEGRFKSVLVERRPIGTGEEANRDRASMEANRDRASIV